VIDRKLTDFIPDDKNANAGSERGAAMLANSLREYGAGRSILVDKAGRVIAGNKTTQAALDSGLTDAIVVETDGTRLVVVQRTDIDLDSPRGRQLALSDNRSSELSLAWSGDVLSELQNSGVDLSAFFEPDELDYLLDNEPGDALPAEPNAAEPLTAHDVPDAVWATDNEWGVPVLDLKMQADAIDQPVLCWGGAGSRKIKRHGGTYHFYTEDYRFEALWRDPSPVVNSGCLTVIEPNFSAYDNMPRYEALHQIGRKRWLARWWQMQGLRVVVDLNVGAEHWELNLLGVPDGWRSFATRGYSDRLDQLDSEYRQAERKAGGATPLFIVYGGGKGVEKHCMEHGYLWIREQRDEAKRG